MEDDGSAYFKIPVNVPVYFQALDADGCAVQTMRSDTYAAPGETLTCNGCHEERSRRSATLLTGASPKAMRRPPSTLQPEPSGSKPYNYPRLVQGVLNAKCVSCHSPANAKFDAKKMPNLTKGDIGANPFQFHTSFVELIAGGYVQYYTKVYKGKDWYKFGRQRDDFFQSYSEPGKVGARGSKLYAILKAGHHGVQLTPDEWRRLILFMDSNGSYLAHDYEPQMQLEGQAIEPVLQ